MLVIRRKVERNQSYTVFMLPGYFKQWPTSDYEHQEILKVFKQDRPLAGIVNDFSEFGISELPGKVSDSNGA
jgi:hypothetical protein